MTVRELIEELRNFNGNSQVLIAEDEELNTLYRGVEVVRLIDIKAHNKVIIYGLTGTEIQI